VVAIEKRFDPGLDAFHHARNLAHRLLNTLLDRLAHLSRHIEHTGHQAVYPIDLFGDGAVHPIHLFPGLLIRFPDCFVRLFQRLVGRGNRRRKLMHLLAHQARDVFHVAGDGRRASRNLGKLGRQVGNQDVRLI
jgi:hypothetical protein